ncbi:chain length determinant protein EpsF [Ramlibacter tataouinensis]|uniref:Chain length determinant protein EpsF n=1 Tax=Ramlibacter tataouinensis (strain ATCC BAA-407 / DSM 14655 / LMG 21543 / TTB310) TaxID=365046 RepID=F5Y0E3_RAMTT|nr:chain length determinant protein EpsF [Ramlibacter tataouinensis]AEG92165.1 Conserved hypothetical protein [Ramlibacter tataouinensis TTB310]
MSIQQFFSILRARWPVAGLILLATIGAALAWVLLRPTHYTARAPVLVDVQSENVGGGYSPSLIASYMATQIDIAKSDRVAERVMEILKDDLPASTSPLRRTSAAADPQAERRERMKTIQENLEVKPARESNIINISYTANTAADAAKVANAFARAYVDVALDIKTAPHKADASWFDEQVKAARAKLEQAQMKLSEFQQRQGIVGANETAQVDFETSRLNELSNQLALVQAQTTDAQSKRGAAGDTVAEAMASPLVLSLRTDIARLEGKLQDSSASLGPQHPTMQRMQAELAALRSRLGQETSRISSSISTSYETGRARERELQAAVAAQKARVLAVNKDRGQLGLLNKDVEAAQRNFEAITNNASKSRLQALTTQTNLMLLASAVEPLEPSGPSAKQALIVATLAGLLLAVAGALMMELANRRVRSIDDITMATQLPVLASLPASTPAFAALPASRRRLALSNGGTA